MYSPTKENNNQTRMNSNQNKYIIKGTRKIKKPTENNIIKDKVKH